MYIVISNDNRVPPDLPSNQVEHWSLNEFINKASNDEGIDIDEGIYYDVECLSSDIYESLLGYSGAGVNIIYYRFDDVPMPNITMMDEVVVYRTKMPEPEVKTEPEPVVQVQPEPIVQAEPQTQIPVQEPIQQPVQQPQMQPQMQVQQPQMQPQYVPQQPMGQMQQQYSQAPIQHQYVQPMNQTPPQQSVQIPNVGTLVTASSDTNMSANVRKQNISNILQIDPDEEDSRTKNRKAAKVILFGSSKGGTGKTFTCLATAYWYAKTHPTESIALADFDIIDGQIGITVNKITPTLQNYYNIYMQGGKDISQLKNCKVKSENFDPNIDFYLAPAQDIPEITNNTQFWTDVFTLLITNYDVVFFDSGIDYLGKQPISRLYKIADKIIITCNPSINSVKSVIKQFKTLSGARNNNVFKNSDRIMDRVNVVLTRVYENDEINGLVVDNLIKHAPVIAAFGNIDNIISRIQWYQEWSLIDTNPEITESLTDIAALE